MIRYCQMKEEPLSGDFGRRKEGKPVERRFGNRLLPLLLLLALLLTACGMGETAAPASAAEEEPAASPAQSEQPLEETPEELPEGAVAVSTVDELLSAIAPNTTIVLREGDYDLSRASDYGREDLKGYYRWELVYGGCQLDLADLNGLQLIGQGEVRILAQPRYAEVLHFSDCWNLKLEGLTLGHVPEAGPCSAGVLFFDGCENTQVENCRLFGCGYEGVTAQGCEGLFLRESRIDSCSGGAVSASSCRDLRLEDCTIADCGQGQDLPAGSLIEAKHCVGLALVNCEITGNRVYRLLQNYWSRQTVMLGCRVADNRVLESMFLLEGRSLTVDKCSFIHRSDERYYANGSTLFAKDPEGEDLISFDLDHMELARAEYEGPQEPETQTLGLPEGMKEVQVSSVDELLAAIGPDTCIVLDEGVYDLSSASDYGAADGTWYHWDPCYDGYTLWVTGVKNLWIQGAGRDVTLISVSPRYAAVFFFVDCENLSLSGFTAGHSEAPGYCAGDVLDLDNCRNIRIDDCGLFGCGVIGICAWNCDDFAVCESEIYECSYQGAGFTNCRNVSFEGCGIRDCVDGNNRIFLASSTVTWNGQELGEGWHLFDGGSWLGETAGW